MRMLLFILLILGLLSTSYSQEEITLQPESKPVLIFLPGRLAIQPLTAHPQEPRVGLRKEVGSSKMKLDIGASLDLLELRPGGDSLERFRAGIDFFTFALSTSSEGLRLQIDAVDGFFGGHLTYETGGALSLRLRLLHLSAHFLDGHYNRGTGTWKDNREPIAFTRDFGELLGIYVGHFDGATYQLYSGFSYATLIRPTSIGRIEFHSGIELRSASLIGGAFDKPVNVFAAYHLTLREINAYIGSSTIDAGVKFGHWHSSGIRVYASYYSGLDFFSQYYDVRREHMALGFAFDFW